MWRVRDAQTSTHREVFHYMLPIDGTDRYSCGGVGGLQLLQPI